MYSPQSKSRYTLRQYVLTWACSDSIQHTYADASPVIQAKQTSDYKIIQLNLITY